MTELVPQFVPAAERGAGCRSGPRTVPALRNLNKIVATTARKLIDAEREFAG
jgi:hypothetical protein